MKRRINKSNRDDASLDKIGDEILNPWFQFTAWAAKIVCIEFYLGLPFAKREQKHLLRGSCSCNDAKEQTKNNTRNDFICTSFLGAVDHDDKCIQKYLFCKENSIIGPVVYSLWMELLELTGAGGVAYI